MMSNVLEVTLTGAVVQKLTNALKDVGTVTMIVTVKLGSDVERTIVGVGLVIGIVRMTVVTSKY